MTFNEEVKKYFELERQIKVRTDQKQDIRRQIITELGDDSEEHVTDTGIRVKVTTVVSDKFDIGAFKKDHRVLYSQYVRTNKSVRVTVK